VSVHNELAAAEARPLPGLEAQRADALSQIAKLRTVLEADQPLGKAEDVNRFGLTLREYARWEILDALRKPRE
jgi:hypothetical protein